MAPCSISVCPPSPMILPYSVHTLHSPHLTPTTVMMNSIINNQRDILLSVEGTNIWSGQQPQQYNSQAIAWSLSHELFTVGKRYQWVAWAYLLGLFVPVPFWVAHRWWPKLRLDYLYTPIIWYVPGISTMLSEETDADGTAGFVSSYYMGWLCVGINSSITSYFAIAWFSQWYLRTRYPKWFVKVFFQSLLRSSARLIHATRLYPITVQLHPRRRSRRWNTGTSSPS